MEKNKMQPAKPAQEFMHNRSMTAAQVDMDQSVQFFLSEMEKGLAGSDSSLHMTSHLPKLSRKSSPQYPGNSFRCGGD
ncbi:MAG: hypothetical protein U5P10_04155 [Spirochaetia bacterium]|nr:hypothetical protein [Spirochaetia bacterium]